MRKFLFSLLLVVATPLMAERETVHLGNEPWPPYVLSGEQKGIAELIVCEALERAGWDCDIQRGDWEATLQRAKDGQLDGIAAVWHTTERAAGLSYSRPYLSNRLVPVYSSRLDLDIKEIKNLSGLRIVTEIKVAYGDEITEDLQRLSVKAVRGIESVFNAILNNQADVGLVDELSARDFIKQTGDSSLVIGQRALAFRELYFAVSKKHPRRGEIIASFNEAYQAMLQDGTINRILDIDWVMTDLEFDGIPDFIHRGGEGSLGGISSGTVYPVGQKDYQMISQPDFTGSNANFQVGGTEFRSTSSATSSSFTQKKCFYDNSTARIVCPTK